VLVLVLIAGFVLSAVSLGTAWWTFTATGGNTTQTDMFNPGSMYSVSCSGCSGFAQGSFSYSTFGGSLGSLYGALEGALIAAVVVAGLATVLGLLALFGRTGRGLTLVGVLLGVLAGGLLVGVSLWVESSQPGAFGSGVSLPGTSSSGPSPSTSFWGTSSAGGAVATWGAGAGWYGALIGGVLVLAVGLALLWVTRETVAAKRAASDEREYVPRARRESPPAFVYAPTVRSSAPTSSYSAPPIDAPVQASAKTPVPVLTKKATSPAEPTVDCPACGYQNSPRARTCTYCQRPMTAR